MRLTKAKTMRTPSSELNRWTQNEYLFSYYGVSMPINVILKFQLRNTGYHFLQCITINWLTLHILPGLDWTGKCNGKS